MMEATSRVCGHLGQNFGSLIDSASGVRTRSHSLFCHINSLFRYSAKLLYILEFSGSQLEPKKLSTNEYCSFSGARNPGRSVCKADVITMEPPVLETKSNQLCIS